ncbi:GNAT family N-acetyltransferase [Streptomyces spectabilis]|uniref:GNAT family N-acetyltransferase n=1 Tax=Streptomyces spectabilis TaxID=68270 RepID=A0A516R151_STRST|nr:GNAT family N-acetyltransferase [Streptomyces spectabilis]QDQ09384.1 GNAT family N-acetyltransferase [Streptomyces spectabilis]
MAGMTTAWTISPEPADSSDALALWRAYYTEMSDRWFQVHEGRDTPPDELEREVVAANDHATLAPPSGVLLLGRYEGEPAGTAGVRLFAFDGTGDGTSEREPTAELKRLFVRKEARGTGGGPVLLAAAEEAARALGARAMLLDTRSDLTEAWSLYERNGYERTARHNDDVYAERWYRKRL